jgi:protein AaeX
MIGECVIDGVFIPRVLVVLMLAFATSLLLRRALRSFNLYRFIWHAGLFDTAVFVALAGLIARVSVGVTYYGIAN